jgi:hypothetical protein
VAEYGTWIAGEVLAVELVAADTAGGDAVDVDGEQVTVELTKA